MHRQNIYVSDCDLGRGLFAARDYDEGEFIFRFTGPVIDFAQVVAKGETEGNALQIGPRSYLDLEAPHVFTNHSCEPNAGVRDDTDMYALRKIRKDAEIRFDYSTTMSEGRWTMACLCGTESCRGVVGDFHALPDEVQRRYIGLRTVQRFILGEVAQTQGAK
ncbi:MAG: SET domain-containing protein-lysine N-methyltransferase [Opitutaceae bacterium]|jgi:hypothetical protein